MEECFLEKIKKLHYKSVFEVFFFNAKVIPQQLIDDYMGYQGCM